MKKYHNHMGEWSFEITNFGTNCGTVFKNIIHIWLNNGLLYMYLSDVQIHNSVPVEMKIDIEKYFKLRVFE